MSNRTELRLTPSSLAGLIAAAPWAALFGACLVLASQSSPFVALTCPAALWLGIQQARASGGLRARRSVVKLTVSGDRLQASLADGRCFVVQSTADSRLFARLALLKLIPKGTTVKLPLVVLINPEATLGLLGNVNAESFRQLRVWLRLSGTAQPGKATRLPAGH